MRSFVACLALAPVLLGCPAETTPAESAAKTSAAKPAAPAAEAAKTPAEGKAKEPAKDAPTPEPNPSGKPAPNLKDGAPLATVSEDVPMPLSKLLGKAPAEAQAKLGEPTGKGMARNSCLRYLPKRTWFECKYALQRYEDPTRTYKAISVFFEDGVSTGAAFEGIPGEGPFDPRAAVAHIGLTLPGDPKESAPKDNVKVWSWFNADARLLIGGLQYRVEVSVVDDAWENSKVELVLNHPLTAAQQAKVKATKTASE